MSHGKAGTAGLDALAKLTAGLGDDSWFAAVGETLTSAEHADAAEHLAALDFPGIPIAGVEGWEAARQAITGSGWDPRWWEREEALRRDCLAGIADRHGEKTVMEALTTLLAAAGDIVHGRAAVAAARSGIADAALVRAAAGAASQACYQAGLDRLAGGGTAFAPKFRLWQGGRWPLGIVAGRFLLF